MSNFDEVLLRDMDAMTDQSAVGAVEVSWVEPGGSEKCFYGVWTPMQGVNVVDGEFGQDNIEMGELVVQADYREGIEYPSRGASVEILGESWRLSSSEKTAHGKHVLQVKKITELTKSRRDYEIRKGS